MTATLQIRRAAQRYRSTAAGISSWHCLSAGAWYEPDNVAFGPLVGCDEHLLAPGAGFTEHPHSSVVIISWVLDGTLRHRDDVGRVRLVGPGSLLVQHAGSGIRHVEENASRVAPLRFVQTTLLAPPQRARLAVQLPPAATAPADVAVHRYGPTEVGGAVHGYVVRGEFAVAGHSLAAGDSVRTHAGLRVAGGDGELLICQLSGASLPAE